MFITGCNRSCQNENVPWNQWRNFRQNNDISDSMNIDYRYAVLLHYSDKYSEYDIQ